MSVSPWLQVVVGDVVRVVRDQSFPCDLVLLSSSHDDSVCYVVGRCSFTLSDPR